MNTRKMYILIKDNVDLGHAILASAHASLGGYLTFVTYELANGVSEDIPNDNSCRTSTELWAASSFRKVVCRVNDDQFEKAKTYGLNMIDYRIMTESALDGAEVAIVFKPKAEWEPFFKSLKLYK